jgi:RimJ/RimL family protein N-acetyltransferase
LNDPEVRAGISGYKPISSEDESDWYEKMRKRPPDEHVLGIEIREGEEWALIGNLGFFNINWRVKTAEFGIVIGRKECWDQGYGTEAIWLLLAHGFETLNLNRIYLRVLDNNPRAKQVYEKMGFVHEGAMRQAEYMEGQYLDVHHLSMLRAEWDRRSQS